MKKILLLLGLAISNISYAQFTIGASGGYNTNTDYFGTSIGGEIGYGIRSQNTSRLFRKMAILAQGEYFSPVSAETISTNLYTIYEYQISYLGLSFRKYFGKNRPNYSGLFIEFGGGSVITNGSDSVYQITNFSVSSTKTTYDNYVVDYGFLGIGWDFSLSPSFTIHTAAYQRFGNMSTSSRDGATYSYVEFPATASLKLGLNWVIGVGGSREGGGKVHRSTSANRSRSKKRRISDYSDYKPW